MPGLSLITTARRRRVRLIAALLFAVALEGSACKQDVGERCERDEDCADPEANYCANVNRLTLNDGTCLPRSRMGMTTDSGMGADAADAGQSVESGAEAAAETAAETPADVPTTTDAPAEMSSMDTPASPEVAPEVPPADLASESGG